MTLGELIAVFRSEVDDKAEPYLWSDTEATEYANDAENEACRRARLIVDSSTTEVTKISVTAAKTSYDLDARIIFIRRVKLATRAQPLEKISYRTLDARQLGWEDETGEPRGYITDLDSGKLRPFPKSDVANTIRLTVVRLPLVPMESTDDEPEINARLHRSLVHWMRYRAYSKQDSEVKDDKKAADSLALFERQFGVESTAVDETWIQQQHGYDENEGLY